MGLFSIFRRRLRYVYSKNEVEALEDYITQQYGEIETVFHELKSPDVHLDIYVIKPTQQENYYKLVTIGVGAYQMQVPQELQNLGMDRAELVTFLPADWNIKGTKEEDYWPIRMMKTVGRLPIWYKTWIGEGHSIASEDGNPYAGNTKQNSCFLLRSMSEEGEERSLLLPSGKKVRFYQIIPTYQEEMDYKLKNGCQALVQKLYENDIDMLINSQRKNVCK